jgi:hypothetical protein
MSGTPLDIASSQTAIHLVMKRDSKWKSGKVEKWKNKFRSGKV